MCNGRARGDSRAKSSGLTYRAAKKRKSTSMSDLCDVLVTMFQCETGGLERASG